MMLHFRLLCTFISFASFVVGAGAQEKLLVRFRTPEQCKRYTATHTQARALLDYSRLLQKTLAVSPIQQAVVQTVDSLCSIASVRTTNPDSLIQLLRFDTTIVEIRRVLRYRIESSKTAAAYPQSTLQWHLDAIGAERAWRQTDGSGIVIGVIDTGIDWEHPLLTASVWINGPEDLNRNGRFDPWPNTEIRDGVRGDFDGKDNDGNGYADDIIGYSFIDAAVATIGAAAGPLPYDYNGHGTAVSGVIAARPSQNMQLRGLAPGSHIMTLAAFDALGWGEEDNIATAIVYAVLNGARVVNCSFGDIVRSTLIAAALSFARAAGVAIVASAGNSGTDLPHYPSDEHGVFSVGASTETNVPAAFSSYGPRLLLLAPGENIATTASGGGIVRVSGTSFSAPLVSATVALLRSLDRNLTVDEIRTILAQSALPSTAPWRPRYGHGILSAGDAIERAMHTGTVRIQFPENHMQYRENQDSIGIVFDVMHPLLQKWRLTAQRGDSVFVLDSAERSVSASSYWVRLPTATHDTAITIRIEALLRTKKTIVDAVTITIRTKDLAFEQARAFQAWLGNQRRIVVVARTNTASELNVVVHNPSASAEPLIEVSGGGQRRRVHAMILPRLPSGMYQLGITAWSETDTMMTTLDSVLLVEDAAAGVDWLAKPYTLEPLLLSGGSIVGDRAFIATRAAPPQNAILLRRTDDTFRILMSSDRTLYLRGIGDTNGDGKREVLTYDAGDTRLYAFDPVPFRTALWGDTIAHTLWAAGLADLDADGRDEILAFRTRRTMLDSNGRLVPRSDALIALGWDGQRYVVADSIELQSLPQPGRTINTISAPLCAVGDFDGDGSVEVAYSDSDGDLEIAEWSAGRFKREYQTSVTPFLAGAGTEFVVAADFDGDGHPEILAGAPALPAYNTIGEYEPPLWHFVLLRAHAPNNYDIIWEDYFWGVRYGRPYYNGVSSGDLDGDGHPEAILSLFPFGYVLRWTDNSFRPFFVCDSVWSNGALVADLDGNGRNELIMTRGLSTARTEFFEYQPAQLPAPVILDAFFDWQHDSLVCRWMGGRRNQQYHVRIAGIEVAQTAGTRISIPAAAVPPCRQCTVEVQSRDGGDSSRWSTPVVVMRTEPLRLVSADTVEAGSQRVHLTFSGRLPSTGILPASLRLDGDSIQWYASYVAVAGVNTLLAWMPVPLSSGRYVMRLMPGTSDAFGNRSGESTIPLIVVAKAPDTPEFYVERLVYATPHAVRVRFNRQPDSATLSLDRITVRPYGSVVQCELTDDLNELLFHLDERYRYEARGFVYSMSFPLSFLSKDGVSMTEGSGNTVAWIYSAMSSDSTQPFPQPWSQRRDNDLRFSHIPFGATLIVMTLGGVELARIVCDDHRGAVRWTPRTWDGQLLQPGVYLYRVRFADGHESGVQKFVIVP
ncbi:MAG: S8 family serine peptidase [Chlorobi bacterium]|nr:S8 family serine peptidase [Chlorobiota bacterium]